MLMEEGGEDVVLERCVLESGDGACEIALVTENGAELILGAGGGFRAVVVFDDVVETGVEAIAVEGEVHAVHHEVLLGAPDVLVGFHLGGFDHELAVADDADDDDGHCGNGDDQVAAVVLDELFGLAGQLVEVRTGVVVFGHERSGLSFLISFGILRGKTRSTSAGTHPLLRTAKIAKVTESAFHPVSMRLTRLQLLDFKNHREVEMELCAQVNCLLGDNGTGKTNVLDAVHYLGNAKGISIPSIPRTSATVKGRSLLKARLPSRRRMAMWNWTGSPVQWPRGRRSC